MHRKVQKVDRRTTEEGWEENSKVNTDQTYVKEY